MARYRKIHSKMWADSKFRGLSRPNPNGQTLWIYLLTGPHTRNIPGIIIAGPATLAESLGWSEKAFNKAFGEVLAKGLAKVSFEDQIIWLPNAIKYNPPANPNVVKSWADTWDEIPECELKITIYDEIKVFLEGFHKGFGEPFAKCCRKCSLKGLPNQEQEQEQEQEEEKEAATAVPATFIELARTFLEKQKKRFPKESALLKDFEDRVTVGAHELHLFHTSDNWTEEEIRNLLDWVLEDEFWSMQIRTLGSIRGRKKGKGMPMKFENARAAMEQKPQEETTLEIAQRITREENAHGNA